MDVPEHVRAEVKALWPDRHKTVRRELARFGDTLEAAVADPRWRRELELPIGIPSLGVRSARVIGTGRRALALVEAHEVGEVAVTLLRLRDRVSVHRIRAVGRPGEFVVAAAARSSLGGPGAVAADIASLAAWIQAVTDWDPVTIDKRAAPVRHVSLGSDVEVEACSFAATFSFRGVCVEGRVNVEPAITDAILGDMPGSIEDVVAVRSVSPPPRRRWSRPSR